MRLPTLFRLSAGATLLLIGSTTMADNWPHLAKCVDDIAFVRSMYAIAYATKTSGMSRRYAFCRARSSGRAASGVIAPVVLPR